MTDLSVNRQRQLALGAAIPAVVFGSSAFADATLPAEATTAFSTVSDQAALMIAAGWPIVAAVIGGLVLIKLFKKVISRVT